MKIKIALLQILGDSEKSKSFAKAKIYMRKAKDLGADLVLFPELWNVNYLSPDEYGNTEEWKKLAIDSGDLQFKEIQSLAKELKLAVVYTYLEKDSSEKLYDSAILIDNNGNSVLTYRKTHTAVFGWESILTSGDSFGVAELTTESGKLKMGIMICYDREFPEVARILMLNGAEIILVPNACSLNGNRLTQFQARGFENMVGVAMANYPSPKFNGRSVAYDGMRIKGQDYNPLIVQAGEEEGIFVAEFDLDKLRKYREKEIWGNAYRRPELYQKLMDKNVEPPFIRKDAKR